MIKYYFCLAFAVIVSLSSFADELVLPQTQNPEAIWRLFPTQNIYAFLQLNTVTGQIYQLHFSTSGDDPGMIPLISKNLAENEKEIPGRFTLYPTRNMYTFILLDQIRGLSWHVQWNNDSSYRFCIPMP